MGNAIATRQSPHMTKNVELVSDSMALPVPVTNNAFPTPNAETLLIGLTMNDSVPMRNVNARQIKGTPIHQTEGA